MSPSQLFTRLRSRAFAATTDWERGDVPGWVLITIMTAGLVTLVWGVASDQLQAILQKSLNSVQGP